MPIDPILRITDGTTVVDLLNSTSGFLLTEWLPQVTAPKDGGVFLGSPLSEGRRIVARLPDNVIETFDLKVRADTQDLVIEKLQTLRRLLEKAVEYWTTPHQSQPVWLEARAGCETNIRYSVIVDWRAQQDGNPYAQPFAVRRGSSLVDDFTLIVEREPFWRREQPGAATCVEAGATEAYYDEIQFSKYVVASSDDCYVNTNTGVIILNDIGLAFGSSGVASLHTGIRFTNVTIPQGATIVKALIQFVCTDLTGGGTPVNVNIYGEDIDDAPTFTTYADFMARTRTTAVAAWNGIPVWVDGTVYYSAVFPSVIQEIIDRAGWVSGNDLVVFIEDNGSSSWRFAASFDHLTYTEPLLMVWYFDTTTRTFGQAATCNNQVFVANKRNAAQLTDIFSYDNGVGYSNNLLLAGPSYGLLPAVPAVDDACYFGICTAAPDSGPFSNLVFDLSAGQTGCTIVWQYFDSGTGWTTFPGINIQDNTSQLQSSGVNAVWWGPVSTWTTTTVNNVTGYWVRALVTVAAAATAPTQQNRDVYSVTWPYVEIPSTEVEGDVPALSRIRVYPEGSAGSQLETDSVIVGARLVDRGADFTAYLNASDEQNPTGVSVSVAGGAAFANNLTASSSGRMVQWASGGVAAMAVRLYFTLSSAIASHFYGKFHAYLRAQQVGGSSGDISFMLRVLVSGYNNLYQDSPTVVMGSGIDQRLVDFGRITIPPSVIENDEVVNSMVFQIHASATVSRTVNVFELILIPADEWIGKVSENNPFGAHAATLLNYLDIDSVVYPRRKLYTPVRNRSSGVVEAVYNYTAVAPVLLPPEKQVRLWFVNELAEGSTTRTSETFSGVRVLLDMVQRYYSMIGND